MKFKEDGLNFLKGVCKYCDAQVQESEIVDTYTAIHYTLKRMAWFYMEEWQLSNSMCQECICNSLVIGLVATET